MQPGLEGRNGSRAGGILTSQASYWAIVVNGEALVIETAKLRDFVLSGAFIERPAGDNKAAIVRLVPVEKLKTKKFVRVIELPPMAPGTG